MRCFSLSLFLLLLGFLFSFFLFLGVRDFVCWRENWLLAGLGLERVLRGGI